MYIHIIAIKQVSDRDDARDSVRPFLDPFRANAKHYW